MKLKSIRAKIGFVAGACLMITALVIIMYAVVIMRGNMRSAAMKEAVVMARGQAAAIESMIKETLDTASTLAQTLSAVKNRDIQLYINRNKVMDILRIILEENPVFTGVYTCWEPDGFDGVDKNYIEKRGHDKSGRFAPHWHLNDKGKPEVTPLLDCPIHSPGGVPGKWYDIPKEKMKEYILDPFRHLVIDKNVMITSLAAPIIANGQFYGVVGVDIRLDFIQSMADNLDIYGRSGKLKVISNNGKLVGVTGSPNLVGRSIKMGQNHKDYEKDLSIIQKGKEERRFVDDNLEIFTPLRIGKTETPWSINVLVPEDKVTAVATKSMWKMIVIGAICADLALVVLLIITMRIVQPIKEITKLATEIGKGNLKVDIPSEYRSDELGVLMESFKSMLENLRGQLQHIMKSVVTLNLSSKEISVSGTQLVSSSTETLTSVEETTTTVEEVKQIAKEAKKKAKNISDSAQKAAQISGEGRKAVDETIERMGLIRDQMLSIDDSIMRLSEQVQSISEIIGTVDDLADQSNLLAVNAAIEATKAGEQGKGFTVVAQEIRVLADQSKQATDKVRTILTDIQKARDTAVMATEKGAKAVEAGVEQSRKAGESILELANSVDEAAQAGVVIATSTQEQSVGMDQIANAMQHVKEATSQNVDASKKLEDTAKSLSKMGKDLEELTKGYKV